MLQDIFQKEQEYRKLNDLLQHENHQLMREFEDVMKHQENLLCKPTPEEPKIAIKNDRIQENYLDRRQPEAPIGVPEGVDEMGVKGMTHFYRAKIKTLQEAYKRLETEHKFKVEEAKKFEKEVQKSTEKTDKWFRACNAHKNTISKLENQIESLNSKVSSKQYENIALRKDVEQFKQHSNAANLSAAAIKVRLTQATEENEKLKNSLKESEREVKELKEAYRKERSELEANIKKLERQKSELLMGLKRQSNLVSNLKKQKSYLEIGKLVDISEKEFVRILDWKLYD